MSKVIITQSNYIPWLGYFYQIHLSDVFVFLDDVQYTKRDWRNRNIIKSNDFNEFNWLTIPVVTSKKYFQKINEVEISDSNWKTKHLNKIFEVYKKERNFKNGFLIIEKFYDSINSNKLSEVNQNLISSICEFLNIKFQPLNSILFNYHENPSERLLEICKELKATYYLTGPNAKNYLEINLFEKIKVEFINYPENIIQNNLKNGIKGYSILDFIIKHGDDSPLKFKNLL